VLAFCKLLAKEERRHYNS